MSEIQRVETTQITPMELLSMAVQSDKDILIIEKLMDLKYRHDAMEARTAYFRAMAQFRAKCPKVIKTKTVSFKGTHYRHAGLGETLEQIEQALVDCGLYVHWEMPEQTDKSQITVTCIVTHEAGHSERTSLTVPYDASGSKNPIQAIGSSVTYAQRYSLFSMLGLAAVEDDDGRSSFGEAHESSQTPMDEDREQEKQEKKAFEQMCLRKAQVNTLTPEELRSILVQCQAFSHLEKIPDCTKWLEKNATITDCRVELLSMEERQPEPPKKPSKTADHRAELESICVCCAAVQYMPVTTDYKEYTLEHQNDAFEPDDVCKALSAFIGKNGDEVQGRAIKDLSDKALAVTLMKARKLEEQLLAIQDE